ncbi:MAG: phosphatase family protein [Burkholderia sp.]|jgi:undecaprenyl-diphosphatase|nr:phosphatase family protein [Burkholderia sp.]
MKIKLAITTLSLAGACWSLPGASFAAGGPLGIDSRLNLDEHGIWNRNNQRTVEYLTVGAVFAGALLEGSDSRLGRTFWQSTDSILLGQAGYLVLNNTFRRQRPSTTDSPNQWFKSGGHSFPSGEVTAISSAITPFVLEYGPEHPSVYALELLPLYDAMARMKSQAHWQTDVLAGWALGTAVGYYAHSRSQPFTVMVLPHGLTVGWHKQF